MVSILIILAHRTAYTQMQEEVIDKDEHINTDTQKQTWTYNLWDEPSMYKKSNLIVIDNEQEIKESHEYSY